MPPTLATRSDIILPMTDDYMQQIVRREKNHEFRRYLIPNSVERIWFYLNAPLSHIAYVCEIDPARTRNPGEKPLVEDGLGNKEFNERHKDWEQYDFAYRIRSVYRLVKPIKLATLKETYGVKGAPRGLVYTPKALLYDVKWGTQACIWREGDRGVAAQQITAGAGVKRRRTDDEPSTLPQIDPKKPVSLLLRLLSNLLNPVPIYQKFEATTTGILFLSASDVS